MVMAVQIPLLRKWTSAVVKFNHEYIDYIFAFEVPPSQREMREEIFRLYLLMLAPFFNLPQNYAQGIDLQPHAQQSTNYSNHISCIFLESLSVLYHIDGLNSLAVGLLTVSLAHADHSAPLIAFLKNLLDTEQGSGWYTKERSNLSHLGQSAIDYLDVCTICLYTLRQEGLPTLFDRCCL
jgi:hypothetical protein